MANSLSQYHKKRDFGKTAITDLAQEERIVIAASELSPSLEVATKFPVTA